MRRAFRPAFVVLAVALGAVVFAGCGDDDDDGGTETVTVQQTVTSEEGTTVEETTTTSDDAAEVQTLAAGKGKEGPKYFQTPSKNIGCYVSGKAARCDIRERDWKPTPEPKSCKKIGLDYGQGIVVAKNHAEFVCAGDTSLGGPATLAYGRASQRGVFRCESEEDGITCTNVENGHGFFLSRQSFRIF